MKSYITYLAMAAAVLAAASCRKNDIFISPHGGNMLELNVSADIPELEMADGTKVTFEGENLKWEGNETMAVLIGNEDSTPTGSNIFPPSSTYLNRKINSGATPGTFAGSIDLGSFSMDDIRGVVVPYDNDNTCYKYKAGGRIVMQFGSDKVLKQVQNSNDVLNGAYAPLFAALSGSDLIDDGSAKAVEGLQLKWGCAVIRFNIFGKHDEMLDGEIFKSISLTLGGGLGTAEWQIDTKSFNFNGSSGVATVELKEACTIADKVQSNGVKVFLTLSPRTEKGGTAVTLTNISITTDKAKYTKTVSKNLNLLAGKVICAGIDMSSFTSREAFDEPDPVSGDGYSIDGGVTWSDTAPTASDNFTSVIVSNVTLSSDDLANLKNAINAQAAPVSLDLTRCNYASETFPKNLFSSTESSPNTKLKHIGFPLNVTQIEAGSSGVGAFTYCTALETIDLNKVTVIGRDSFTYSGLVRVNIPNTVKTIGNQAFRWCYRLADIYYDSTYSTSSTSSNIFSIGDTFLDYNPYDVYRTVTFGPHVTQVPADSFRSCAFFKKVVFEGSPVIASAAFSKDKYLDIIECHSATPPTKSGTVTNNVSGTATGELATQKKIIVPKGALSDYQSSKLWGEEFRDLGYTIVEAE